MITEYHRLNILVDSAFKHFFAHEKRRSYAEYLIDAILQHNNELLKESIIIQENKSITLRSFGGKTMMFDFIATNSERKINIEIENTKKHETDYLPRIEAYSSAIYLENFQKGMKYEQLLKTTTISIINYNLSDDNEFYTHHTIKLGSKDISKGKIEHYIIQIPKFRKHIKNLIENKGMERFINQIKYNKLYKILLYFDIKTDKELVNEVVKMDPTISELHEKTESARRNTEESEIMGEFMKTYKKQEQEDIDWDKVREDGIEKGKKEGKEEGIKEGIKKGKKEIALNLKTKGYSLDEIKEITGLPMKEIESLSENTK